MPRFSGGHALALLVEFAPDEHSPDFLRAGAHCVQTRISEEPTGGIF